MSADSPRGDSGRLDSRGPGDCQSNGSPAPSTGDTRAPDRPPIGMTESADSLRGEAASGARDALAHVTNAGPGLPPIGMTASGDSLRGAAESADRDDARATNAEPNRTRETVRGAVLADLAPVRPLSPPGRRALALLPVGVLLLAFQPLYWGLRHDAAVLGWLRLWGFSAAQSLLGLVLVGAALREAVPGRRLPRPQVLLAVGILASVAITYITWLGSSTHVPPGRMARYWVVCFSRPVVMGAPVLAAVLALAWRAYPLRAALVGAFAGLGVGLMTDAGWRTYCHVSDPAHVLGAHLVAILALVVAGAASAALLAHIRE